MGRLPPGAVATGLTSIEILDNDHRLYADDRRMQIDMRFAKILRFGAKRIDFGADLYNVFNVNTPVAYDGTYDVAPAAGLGPGGEWLRPTTIVQPRFARVNLRVRF